MEIHTKNPKYDGDVLTRKFNIACRECKSDDCYIHATSFDTGEMELRIYCNNCEEMEDFGD